MESLPANLTVEALALSPAETKTYLRWYTDLLLRKRGETIAVNDAMAFVDNFGLSELDKSRILRLFGGQMVSIEPAQFYAFIRLCGHAKQGRSLRKELAFVSAPVPKPRSILSKRKASEGVDRSESPDPTTSNPFRKTSGGAKDIDTFMSLMTGKPTTSAGAGNGRRKKRVTFDSGPPQVAEAAQRSMEELLRQRGVELPVAPSPPVPPVVEKPQEDEPDVAINPNSHFAQVNIDSVLVHGTSVVPPAPPPRRLAPNMTGPVQMVQIGALAPDSSLSAVSNAALQPNHTGQLPLPAFPMARQPSPQLLAPQPPRLSQPYPVPSYQATPSLQNLSPMPTGLEFLNSVSRSSPQHLSPANTGYARPAPMAAPVAVGNDYDIAPPPPFRRASNPYDTQTMRNQVNNMW